VWRFEWILIFGQKKKYGAICQNSSYRLTPRLYFSDHFKKSFFFYFLTFDLGASSHGSIFQNLN
jgi:hypothetical protein